MHRIVLIGPPASGKGTQCRRIQQMLGIPTLGTGALLRREIESGSELGVEVEAFLTKGAYVPDELMMKMIQSWITENSETGWLLDGFPRTLAQAQWLESGKDFAAPTLAIALDVSEQELAGRIAGRRECADCGATVSVQSDAEKTCPHCSGELQSRSDDNLESFRTRFANYRELTQPLFDYYAAQGKLLRVNGSNTPDDVFAVIENHLNQ